MPDEEKLAAIRALLPSTSAGIELNVADAGPLPAETARAMQEAADWELRTGRGHAAALDERAGRLDEARGAIAAILHADIDRVAIAHSAAEALAALIASGGPAGRIGVAAELDQAVGARVAAAARAAGASVAVVSAMGPLPPLDRLVVPHVTSEGAVVPVGALVVGGAEVLVDGSLAAGAIPVDVEALGVAAYATDAQRWLLGPQGMAAVAVQAPERAADARSVLEAAAFHGPSVLGMARSAGWLAMYVGLDWLTDRTLKLARRLGGRLTVIEHVEVVTPLPPEAGIVAFRLPRWDLDEAFDELSRRSFAILGQTGAPAGPTGPEEALRASVGAWNTEAEIDHFTESVALVASHTAATIPRRPTLTILHDGGS
jgi:selenocysteine lyase/cysteine desulfurase